MYGRTLIPATAGAALVSLAGPSFALSPAFPKTGLPVRSVVPFPGGGLGDVMTPPVAQRLASNRGVPVIVENKPGNSANRL